MTFHGAMVPSLDPMWNTTSFGCFEEVIDLDNLGANALEEASADFEQTYPAEFIGHCHFHFYIEWYLREQGIKQNVETFLEGYAVFAESEGGLDEPDVSQVKD